MGSIPPLLSAGIASPGQEPSLAMTAECGRGWRKDVGDGRVARCPPDLDDHLHLGHCEGSCPKQSLGFQGNIVSIESISPLLSAGIASPGQEPSLAMTARGAEGGGGMLKVIDAYGGCPPDLDDHLP